MMHAIRIQAINIKYVFNNNIMYQKSLAPYLLICVLLILQIESILYLTCFYHNTHKNIFIIPLLNSRWTLIYLTLV